MNPKHWPPHGWTCFHCGSEFPATKAGERAAAEHFGNHPDALPECRDAASPARKLARRARQAEAASRAIARDRDKAEDLCMVAEAALYNLRRKLGVNRHADLAMEVDSLQGEVIAAKAVVGYIEKRFPNIVQKARQSV